MSIIGKIEFSSQRRIISSTGTFLIDFREFMLRKTKESSKEEKKKNLKKFTNAHMPTVKKNMLLL